MWSLLYESICEWHSNNNCLFGDNWMNWQKSRPENAVDMKILRYRWYGEVKMCQESFYHIQQHLYQNDDNNRLSVHQIHFHQKTRYTNMWKWENLAITSYGQMYFYPWYLVYWLCVHITILYCNKHSLFHYDLWEKSSKCYVLRSKCSIFFSLSWAICVIYI